MNNLKEMWTEQYRGLTEDLPPFEKCPDMGREWVIHKALRQEQAHLQYLEDTGKVADITTFTTVAMPLVRKIFSRLIAMDLVSVQPISQPTAKIFYLDFVYGDTGSGVSKGDSIYAARDKAYATRSVEESSVKDLQLKLTSSDVSAVEKALKAKWSIELEQDLQAYHGLSVEAELMAILQQEITIEIDGLILYSMLQGATAGNINWNINGYLGDDKSTWERKEYRKSLFEALVDAGNSIFKKRYRYGTWIVGHPDAIVRLEKCEDFKYAESDDPYNSQIGRHLVGTLFGRWKVYKDPFWPQPTKLLMGYKGATWSDTSAYFSPYIPLYTTPLIVDPNDFTPRRGLLSRFAYGTLIGDGLATVTLTQS